MFFKKKKEADKEFLTEIKKLPCLACGNQKNGFNIIDAHHIKTRGSGGDDSYWNVIPLCRLCHTRWHRIGSIEFLRQHMHVLEHLENLGWEFEGRELTHTKERVWGDV